MNGESLRILLVEDDEAHAGLVKMSFSDHKVANEIYHVSDGEQALDFLFRRGEYEDPLKSPRPHLVLLDLRLPKIDGIEVLTEIKQSEATRDIPVVVLTTSDSEKDVSAAYSQYVNSYLVKPVGFENFKNLMNDLGYYWLIWNKNPWKR